jgi:hypothetical protein
MCMGGDQTVTQRTELDPSLQRLLYGGALGPQHGLRGAAPAGGPSRPGLGGLPGLPFSDRESGGSVADLDMRGSGPVSSPIGSGQPGSGVLYAQGGPVQSGIASLQGGMPMAQGLPMMNGQLPNLSNPEIAATLAMAQMRPDMMRQRFAAGGYVEGPGTGTSDSIPAMIHQNGQPVQRAALSDGEFVMTERAVRGAGGGDRERGAARMYEMMRKFERGGRV